MAEGRSRSQWGHTAALLAMLANTHRDPKKTRAFRPEDFDPHGKASRDDTIEVNQENVSLLRAAFTGMTAQHQAEDRGQQQKENEIGEDAAHRSKGN